MPVPATDGARASLGVVLSQVQYCLIPRPAHRSQGSWTS